MHEFMANGLGRQRQEEMMREARRERLARQARKGRERRAGSAREPKEIGRRLFDWATGRKDGG